MTCKLLQYEALTWPWGSWHGSGCISQWCRFLGPPARTEPLSTSFQNYWENPHSPADRQGSDGSKTQGTSSHGCHQWHYVLAYVMKQRIMGNIWLCWWGRSSARPVWLWSGRAAVAPWAGPWGRVLSQAVAQLDPAPQPPAQLSECATGPAHPIYATRTRTHAH